LGEPDRIDPMQTGLWNMIERMMGAHLYHCRFCRVQFYDRRPPASQPSEPHSEHATATGNSRA